MSSEKEKEEKEEEGRGERTHGLVFADLLIVKRQAVQECRVVAVGLIARGLAGPRREERKEEREEKERERTRKEEKQGGEEERGARNEGRARRQDRGLTERTRNTQHTTASPAAAPRTDRRGLAVVGGQAVSAGWACGRACRTDPRGRGRDNRPIVRQDRASERACI